MKDKTQTITFYAVCIFLFCYFMRIFNMPNELTVIAGGLLCLALVIQQKKIRIDLGICLLAIIMVSYYVIINGARGLAFSILYIPLIIYELGNYTTCANRDKNYKEQKFLLLIFIMVIGYTIHGLLNSYMWYAGYAVPGTRRWQDFWSLGITPGTQHAAYFMPAMAMFVPSVLYFKNRRILNSMLIIMTIYFGYTALATRSRMSVLIFVIVFCMQVLMFAICEKEKVKKQIKNKWLWAAIVAFMAIVIVGAFAVKDSAVVVAFIENMSKGGGIINNIRFQAQGMALQQLFDYPMGGYLMDFGGISHSHNTWLDMANAAGVIPFFAFVIYTAFTLYELVRLLLRNDITAEIKMVLIGLYGSFFLYFTVEPALEASVHLVTPWIFLNGIVHGQLMSKDKG